MRVSEQNHTSNKSEIGFTQLLQTSLLYGVDKTKINNLNKVSTFSKGFFYLKNSFVVQIVIIFTIVALFLLFAQMKLGEMYTKMLQKAEKTMRTRKGVTIIKEGIL